MKSTRGIGQAFSFVQVEQEIDIDYIKQMMDETKSRVEGPSFLEQRAMQANKQGQNDDDYFAEELNCAHQEIERQCKELKSLLTVSDFLLENREELEMKLGEETMALEGCKRDFTTMKLRYDQVINEVSQLTTKLEKSQATTQQLEKALNESKEQNTLLKQQKDQLSKRVEGLQNELMNESEKRQDSSEQLDSVKKDYDQRLIELDQQILELQERLSKQAAINDEKDLEISRLRRESEETAKKNKGQNEKIVSYQATNERLRKDKLVIEEKYADLQKQFQMHKLMFSGKNNLGHEDSSQSSDEEGSLRKKNKKKQNNDLGELAEGFGEETKQTDNDMNDLRELQDMNGSFDGGYQNQTPQQYMQGEEEQFSPEFDHSGRRESMARFSVVDQAAGFGSAQQHQEDFNGPQFINQTEQTPEQQMSPDQIRKSVSQLIPVKKEMIDQEIQTDDLQVTEKKIQTDSPQLLSSYQQTEKLENKSHSAQIGCSYQEFEHLQVQTDTQEPIQLEIQINLGANEIIKFPEPIQETPIAKKSQAKLVKPKIGLQIETEEEDKQSMEKKETKPSDQSQTNPSPQQSQGLDHLKSQANYLQTPSSKNTFNSILNQEYQNNRDPLKEFFTLTLQSVKLSSPHMNMICMINSNVMYEKALKDNIPFFKWYTWIETTIQKEVLSKIITTKKSPDSRKAAMARPPTFGPTTTSTKSQTAYQKLIQLKQAQKAEAAAKQQQQSKTNEEWEVLPPSSNPQNTSQQLKLEVLPTETKDPIQQTSEQTTQQTTSQQTKVPSKTPSSKKKNPFSLFK